MPIAEVEMPFLVFMMMLLLLAWPPSLDAANEATRLYHDMVFCSCYVVRLVLK